MSAIQTQPEGAVTSVSSQSSNRVLLAHGGGGELTGGLIADHIVSVLRNNHLAALNDSAVLPWTDRNVVFTTDSYVVTPLEFPGGDIGRLSVAGTVNDLAVMGAEPVALSLGLIIEEGLPFETLDRIIESIRRTANQAGVSIVTGDTKVIERRAGDGLMINTAGVGRLLEGANIDLARVVPGDAVIVSGTLADHGLTIMSIRDGIEFDTTLQSDAAPLNEMIHKLVDSGVDIKFMRDATRGGVAGVLADISERRGISIEVDESRIPIKPGAQYAADMLGLDPLTIANEGKILCIVAMQDTETACDVMRRCPEGRHAAVIGRMTDEEPPLVELITTAGGRRIVQRPYGEELPRIC